MDAPCWQTDAGCLNGRFRAEADVRGSAASIPLAAIDPKATCTRQQGPLAGVKSCSSLEAPWHERASLRLLSAQLYCVAKGVEEVAGASRATPGSADGLAPILPAIVSTP
jgi:hypothetical protein